MVVFIRSPRVGSLIALLTTLRQVQGEHILIDWDRSGLLACYHGNDSGHCGVRYSVIMWEQCGMASNTDITCQNEDDTLVKSRVFYVICNLNETHFGHS